MSDRFDIVSFVAGIALAAVGLLLLLDQEQVLDISLGLTTAVITAVVGVILVASGFAESRDGR